MMYSTNFKSASFTTSSNEGKLPPFFQPKLTVNTPGDKYEQEADAVADQVMRMPAFVPSTNNSESNSPVVQRMLLTPLNGVMRMCSKCAENEEEKHDVRRKESGVSDAGGKTAPSIVSDVLSSGGGQVMDGGTRQFMESRFGQDFSAVRIHTGGKAAESAGAIQARAYTSGKDVVFRSGEYQPSSESGKRLLAHELAHVRQQRGDTTETIGRLKTGHQLDSIQSSFIQRDKAETTEHVAGTLWATDAMGNALLPSLDDISQGNVGNCFLFAAMAAIVNTNPQKIVDMIKDNGDGTYTVTFAGIGFWSSAEQTVNADFPLGKHGNVRGRNAIWPLIIESAYIKEKGGLAKVEKGGNSGEAVDEMLNVGASSFDPRDESVLYILGKVITAKENKWPVTILAPKQEGASKEKKEMANNTPGFHFNHGYAVIDFDAAKDRLKLFNPWGRDHPNGDGWVEIEQIRKFFIEVVIND